MPDDLPAAADRRRAERRVAPILSEMTLPEARRIVVTSALFVAVLLLFLWMVRPVIVAGLLGAVVALYLRPAYAFVLERTGRKAPAALLVLLALVIPLLAMIIYSYREVLAVLEYASTHEAEIAAEVDAALRRLPFGEGMDTSAWVERMVATASAYGARLPGMVGGAVGDFVVSGAVFLFTAFYVFTEGEEIVRYLRAKVPPRYGELAGALETNVRGVLYGAVYATLVTQVLKSLVVLALNLLLGVPLAFVLAILAFLIGFFPIVGSWSVYLPVALWLLVFREAPEKAALMLAVGFLFNTLFVSMYLRPKIAAEKSGVLNFYWMFLGLVAGVYTLGLAGILLGPILIGVLKAVFETATGATWRLVEPEEA